MSKFEEIHSLTSGDGGASIIEDMDRLGALANIGGLGDPEDGMIKPRGWDMKFNSAPGNPEIINVTYRGGASPTYGDDLADKIF